MSSKCGRCGRTLRSVKSIAAGYGPTCLRNIREAAALEAARMNYSPAQLDRAQEIIADNGILAATPDEFEAVASDGSAIYTTTDRSCTCKAGEVGRKCYHQLARRAVTVAQPAPVTVSDGFLAEMERLTECFMAMA